MSHWTRFVRLPHTQRCHSSFFSIGSTNWLRRNITVSWAFMFQFQGRIVTILDLSGIWTMAFLDEMSHRTLTPDCAAFFPPPFLPPRRARSRVARRSEGWSPVRASARTSPSKGSSAGRPPRCSAARRWVGPKTYSSRLLGVSRSPREIED